MAMDGHDADLSLQCTVYQSRDLFFCCCLSFDIPQKDMNKLFVKVPVVTVFSNLVYLQHRSFNFRDNFAILAPRVQIQMPTAYQYP